MRPTPLRTAARVGAILAMAAPLAVLGVRAYARLTNRPFYRAATRRIALPGLSEGFIPQDLFYCKSSKTWLFSGYMNDGSASPLYRVGPNGAVSRLLVRLADGSTYSGHGAAITAAGDYAFLSVQDGYAVMDLDAVLSCEDGRFDQALAHVPLELVPAFMIVQHRTLYVGEFYYPVNFETPKSHHITTPDGTRNHAIMLAYPADPAAGRCTRWRCDGVGATGAAVTGRASTTGPTAGHAGVLGNRISSKRSRRGRMAGLRGMPQNKRGVTPLRQPPSRPPDTRSSRRGSRPRREPHRDGRDARASRRIPQR